jgi:hypothetical protein
MIGARSFRVPRNSLGCPVCLGKRRGIGTPTPDAGSQQDAMSRGTVEQYGPAASPRQVHGSTPGQTPGQGR